MLTAVNTAPTCGRSRLIHRPEPRQQVLHVRHLPNRTVPREDPARFQFCGNRSERGGPARPNILDHGGQIRRKGVRIGPHSRVERRPALPRPLQRCRPVGVSKPHTARLCDRECLFRPPRYRRAFCFCDERHDPDG